MDVKIVDNFFTNPISKLVKTDTNTDFFVPANILNIYNGLKELISQNVVSNGLFLDAGCGDGRVLSVTYLFNIPSLGVEYDIKLFELAKSNLTKLKINSTLIRGNFLDDEVYKKVGGFSNIKTIFNYYSGFELIFDKFKKESSIDSVFLLYTTDNEVMSEELYQKSIKLNDATIQVYKK